MDVAFLLPPYSMVAKRGSSDPKGVETRSGRRGPLPPVEVVPTEATAHGLGARLRDVDLIALEPVYANVTQKFTTTGSTEGTRTRSPTSVALWLKVSHVYHPHPVR